MSFGFPSNQTLKLTHRKKVRALNLKTTELSPATIWAEDSMADVLLLSTRA
jgi:hypothetical protein